MKFRIIAGLSLAVIAIFVLTHRSVPNYPTDLRDAPRETPSAIGSLPSSGANTTVAPVSKPAPVTGSYDKASDDNKRVLTCYTSGDALEGIYITPQTIEIQTPSGKSYLYSFDHRFYGQTGTPFIMRGANAIDALGGEYGMPVSL